MMAVIASLMTFALLALIHAQLGGCVEPLKCSNASVWDRMQCKNYCAVVQMSYYCRDNRCYCYTFVEHSTSSSAASSPSAATTTTVRRWTLTPWRPSVNTTSSTPSGPTIDTDDDNGLIKSINDFQQQQIIEADDTFVNSTRLQLSFNVTGDRNAVIFYNVIVKQNVSVAAPPQPQPPCDQSTLLDSIGSTTVPFIVDDGDDGDDEAR